MVDFLLCKSKFEILKKLAYIFWLLFISTPVNCQVDDLIHIRPFGSNPGNLKMYVYKPTNIDSLDELPLVVVLHGCTQTAHICARQTG